VLTGEVAHAPTRGSKPRDRQPSSAALRRCRAGARRSQISGKPAPTAILSTPL
jgi:hypothetical protein